MEEDRLSRTRMLIGEQGLRALSMARVAVIGLGGVGSFAAEALARCGVGNLVLIDHDIIVPSNLNRQLPALQSTLGRLKAEVVKERILEINPELNVTALPIRFNGETCEGIISQSYDHVVDAIDSVEDKLLLIQACWEKGLKIISCMGTGNRIDPTMLKVGDIKETSVCPLARRIRKGLRQVGIYEGVKVVYSLETPHCAERHSGRVGSMALVPPAAGIIMAAEVVKHLLYSGVKS